ncbi:hypothetical protein [uncultured Photobacterium sp.]|uniref:hypothetical protein n=1 Tax=uncultured Photobacterium sp. TaxID=173973 RepID=UPI00260C7DCB|nr:hypothetical protein [uncultured Photobacterium sp.]
MKHKRVSNKRIKQMMGEINHDGLFDEALNTDVEQPLVEKKQQDTGGSSPGFKLDDENK